ncbi:MAG: hypothetical protein ACKVS8_09025 [Phycisphaerales bacterium]
MNPIQSRPVRAFSLIETALATILIGTLLVATLNGVGAVALSRSQTSEHALASRLAQSLIDEVLQLPYNDPQTATCTLTPAAGEVTGNRSLFDNVGDYGGWVESKPTDKAGVALAGAPAFGRAVTLAYVVPATPNTTSGTDKGAVLITVSVKRGTRTLATAAALRARAFDTSVLTPPNTSGTRSTSSTIAFGAAP